MNVNFNITGLTEFLSSCSYGTVSEGDKSAFTLSAPHPANRKVTTHTAQEAYQRFQGFADASNKRLAADTRLIAHVRNKNVPGSLLQREHQRYQRFAQFLFPGL